MLVQKWNSPQDGHVRYIDAAVGDQMNAGGLSCLVFLHVYV